MTIDETRRTNRMAMAAVLLTALSIALTILVRTIVEVSGTKERVVAVEKAVENINKEMAVVREDVKRLLQKP